MPEIYSSVTGRDFEDPMWIRSETFGKDEWEILKRTCSEMYPDEELAFEMMYSLLDIENRATSLNQRKGILDHLESCIKQNFYKDEDDATAFYLNKVSRKKEYGAKYDERFMKTLPGNADETGETGSTEEEDV